MTLHCNTRYIYRVLQLSMQRLWNKARVVRLHERPIESGMLEEQHLPALLVIPLGLVGGAVIAGFILDSTTADRTIVTNATVVGTTAFIALLLYMRTCIEVTPQRVSVVFRPFYKHSVAINDIELCHEFTAMPAGNAPLQGPAIGFGQRVAAPGYTGYRAQWVEATHGVRITLRDGKQWLVNSAHPQRLIHALDHAKREASLS